MARALKVATYQLDGDDESLRSALLSIDGLRIAGQWDASVELDGVIRQTRIDVLAVVLSGPSSPKLLERLGSLAREHPELTVIGVGLPNDPELLKLAMRARLSELIDSPVDPERLLQALAGAAEKLASRPSGRLIAVRGTGGGSGATTIATNLAVELAKGKDRRVVVVDLDLKFGHVATMLDVSPTHTLAELAQQSEEYDERLLNNALAKHESGVSVLARPRDPENANVSLVKLSAILNALLENFDWVVVDEPGRSDMTARVVQDLADALLLVTQLAVPSVRNASQIIAALTGGFNMDRMRILVNRVPKKGGVFTAEKVADTLKRPIFCEIPDDWETVSHAVNLGVPVVLDAPDSKVAAAFTRLAGLLEGEASRTRAAAAGADQPPSGKSIMGWLRDRLGRG